MVSAWSNFPVLFVTQDRCEAVHTVINPRGLGCSQHGVLDIYIELHDYNSAYNSSASKTNTYVEMIHEAISVNQLEWVKHNNYAAYTTSF